MSVCGTRRLGDYIGLGQCISVESVAAAAKHLARHVNTIEIMDGGQTAFWLNNGEATRPDTAVQGSYTQNDTMQWSRVLSKRLRAALRAALPNARMVHRSGNTSVDADFYHMVFAPMLLTAAGSFAAAAAAASHGHHVLTPASKELNFPHLGQLQARRFGAAVDNWHLYPYEMLNISDLGAESTK